MPTTKQTLSHALNVAKWRGEQQLSLIQSDAKVSKLENDVRLAKATLADKVFTLYLAGGVDQPELKEQCEKIQSLFAQIKEEKAKKEQIAAEQPPEMPDEVYSAALPVKTNGKTCPRCGGKVPGKFCPKDGTPVT